jgi:phage terminase Nu1 subunit (DNA packaging protein)
MPKKTASSKGAPSPHALFLNKFQLAQAIPASIRTIDYWRQQGIIPFVKIRGVVRFDLAKVLAALSRFEVREKTVNAER